MSEEGGFPKNPRLAILLPEFLFRLAYNMLISLAEKVHKNCILKTESFQKKASALPVSTFFFAVDTEALSCKLSVELTKTLIFPHQNSVPVFCSNVIFLGSRNALYQSTPSCIKKFRNHPCSPFLYNL